MSSLTFTAVVTDSVGVTGSASATVTIAEPALFTENFDTLAVGTALTNTNTAFASVAGTLVIGGPTDRYVQATNNPALTRLDTPTWTPSAQLLATQEVTFDSVPSAAVRAGGARASAVTEGALGLSTASKFQLFDDNTSVATSTPSFALGVRYKIEHLLDSVAHTQTLRVTRVSDAVVIATLTGAYTGPALDSYRFGLYTAATVAEKIHTTRVTAGADWVPDSPPPATRLVLVGASSNRPSVGNARTSTLNLEAALRAATGQTKQHLFVRHTYNGNTFPATFAETLAANDPADGYKVSVINVKGDWATLANGGYASRIAGFKDSIPAGHIVYFIFGHEPSNDGRQSESPVWCAGQVTGAVQVAGFNDDRMYWAICNMVTDWYGTNGAETWYDPIIADSRMTAAVRHRTVWAPDGYCKHTDSSGTNYTTPITRFQNFIDWCTANDVPLRAVSENALNNDVGASQAANATWLTNVLGPWLAAVRPEYYLYYESPGPAAGGQTPDETTAEAQGKTPYLDTPAEQLAFGNICLANNYPT